jgi:AmmeMemoRadiSam system protein B
VVSSDLSHYHDDATAKRLDAATAATIEALDPTLGPQQACGHLPIAGLLIEARDRGIKVLRLDLRHSSDTAGPSDRVVGYGSWAFC